MLKTLQLKKLRLGWKRLMCCLLFAIHSPVGTLFPGAILSSSGAVCVWEDAAGSCPSACSPLRTAVEWPWVEEAVCLSLRQPSISSPCHCLWRGREEGAAWLLCFAELFFFSVGVLDLISAVGARRSKTKELKEMSDTTGCVFLMTAE